MASQWFPDAEIGGQRPRHKSKEDPDALMHRFKVAQGRRSQDVRGNPKGARPTPTRARADFDTPMRATGRRPMQQLADRPCD
eukprot:3246625-Pyramimonas_sp.AAC.1